MNWLERLSDPIHHDRTEKIIDILLMRSCEFVCVIDVRNSTATFQFISEELQNLAPHWRQDEEMDFDENMRQPCPF